ncbi:MAG: lipopolysaccharide biosynthesis protein [Petrimonas sp.]|jgi:O-antigen/teichoic acid export membrane protein
MSNSLQQRAVSSVYWTAIQQFGNQGIQFVVSIILARLLLPEEFGLIGMIYIFMGIGATLIDSGLGASIVRTTNPDQRDYSTVFFFNLFGSILIYGIMFVSAPLVAKFYGQESLIKIIRLYCLIFIFNAFSTIQLTRLQKSLNFKPETLSAIVSTVFSGVLGVYLAYSGYGVMSLVLMAITNSIVKATMLWVQTRWKPDWIFDKEKFKYHFGFGSRLMVSGILGTIYNNIYNVLIGKYFSTQQLGYYNRADTLILLPAGNIGTILGKVTYPLFAEVKDDEARLRNAYRKIMKMVIFIISPTLVFMGVLAEPLFRFMFTEKWLPAVPYFQILVLTGILYPIHVYNLNILQVKGRSDLLLKIEIIKKIIITIVVIISFQFGMIGLLWGMVFTSITSLFLNCHYSGKFLNYGLFKQINDMLPGILLSVIIGVVIYLIDSQVFNSNHDLIRLLVGVSLAILLYLAFAYLLKFEEPRNIKKLLLTKKQKIKTRYE